MNVPKWAQSSTSEKRVKLRIKSLVVAALPILNELAASAGLSVSITESNIVFFLDFIFVGIGVASHVWGWIRRDLLELGQS